MTGPCFVDANVFIYARDARDARRQERAMQWIDVLWRDRLGRTSAQAIAELYAVALTVRSPFTLQVSEAAATYAVERRGPGLHRPRGRPKRAAAPA